MQTKIFSENAAQDQITAHSRKLDWNLKQEDKNTKRNRVNKKSLNKSTAQNRIIIYDNKFN